MLPWARPHAQPCLIGQNDQAMCGQPDFSSKRDQTLCGKHDVPAVFVPLGALWLIARCRKVGPRAQCLIASTDICPHDKAAAGASGKRSSVVYRPRGRDADEGCTGVRGVHGDSGAGVVLSSMLEKPSAAYRSKATGVTDGGH